MGVEAERSPSKGQQTRTCEVSRLRIHAEQLTPLYLTSCGRTAICYEDFCPPSSDHPQAGDDGGAVTVIDLGGKDDPFGWMGQPSRPAWSPDSSEIWFTATRTGGDRSLYGRGSVRESATAGAGELTILDVGKDGMCYPPDTRSRCDDRHTSSRSRLRFRRRRVLIAPRRLPPFRNCARPLPRQRK